MKNKKALDMLFTIKSENRIIFNEILKEKLSFINKFCVDNSIAYKIGDDKVYFQTVQDTYKKCYENMRQFRKSMEIIFESKLKIEKSRKSFIE